MDKIVIMLLVIVPQLAGMQDKAILVAISAYCVGSSLIDLIKGRTNKS